jgi:hypothetical protein
MAELRTCIEKHVHIRFNERPADQQWTWDEMQLCIARGLTDLAAARIRKPTPDPRMAQLSLEAFQKGDSITSEEWLDELRGRVAEAGS